MLHIYIYIYDISRLRVNVDKAKVAVCSENNWAECNHHVESAGVKPGGT